MNAIKGNREGSELVGRKSKWIQRNVPLPCGRGRQVHHSAHLIKKQVYGYEDFGSTGPSKLLVLVRWS